MKIANYLSILVLLLTFTSFSQSVDYQCTIDRKNHSTFVIENPDGSKLFLTHQKKEITTIANLNVIQFLNGTGGQEDLKGDKERHKTYMIDQSMDTILTVRKFGDQIEVSNGSIYNKYKTNFGWAYLDESGQTVSEIHLLWNKKDWRYIIKYPNPKLKPEELHYYTLLTLVPMAKNETTDKSDYNYFNYYWLALALNQD